MTSNQKSIRVLLVEDEDFTRTMVGEMLTTSGISVNAVKSVSQALATMDEFDPHVVLTDLDLGHGPDGADLLTKVFTERPWTGMVIMTAHASPELAINDASRIPDPTVYIVKSQLQSMQNLVSAIEESISKTGNFQNSVIQSEEKINITASQAEIAAPLCQILISCNRADHGHRDADFGHCGSDCGKLHCGDCNGYRCNNDCHIIFPPD